jgi:hypothetical protein
MGQLKLGHPDNVSSPRVARFLKAEANCHVKAKANSHLSGVADFRPRLTTQHLERLKAKTKDHLRGAGELATVGTEQRFVPGAQAVAASGDQQFAVQPPLTPLLAFPSGIRALVAVLILVASLPSLTLGAMFWLGVINAPWSVTLPPNESPQLAVQSAIPRVVLTAPATFEATAGEDVAFPIALDGTDGVPARSIIAISGLPQGSTLSNGRSYGETGWTLKSDEIGDLHLVLPKTASGETKLRIQLVAPDDEVIADTETLLKVASNPKGYLELAAEAGSGDAPLGAIYPNFINIGAYGIKPELAKAQAWHEQVQELGTKGAEAKLAEAAKATP